MRSLGKHAALGLAAAGLMVGLTTAPAHAVPAPNGASNVLAAVGSDTTFDVMGKILKKFNVNTTFNPAPIDTAKNVPPVLAAGGSYAVPGDANCAAFSYTNPGNLPPNGSSSGITALINDTTGCVDMARSSRGRSGSDPANIEFYAYAKDAVSWDAFRNTACPGTDTGPVGCAPKNLTQQNLKDIYGCVVNNWSAVGGDPGVIVRYTAQAGSGTRSFFDSKVLGGNTSNNPACPSTEIQENDSTLVAAGDRATALLPYSFAQFTAQKNLVVPDLRAGTKLGNINGVQPNTTTIGNATFLGVRWVYNVAKTTSPSYGDVLRAVGVDATGPGFLCSGSQATNITLYGFVPIASGPSGPGLPNSTCRKEPAPL
ncbi:MAG TPA: substrate-binding domain-containing protein [Acidimicrobiales bacterium]|nr:substrate-binding domain-containing protein [Acidimicrobiales bacterium]